MMEKPDATNMFFLCQKPLFLPLVSKLNFSYILVVLGIGRTILAVHVLPSLFDGKTGCYQYVLPMSETFIFASVIAHLLSPLL